jgi:predicted amidohydrolase
VLGRLDVAAAQPETVAHEVDANAARHAELIRAASARVVVFPELSLTGYELEADALGASAPALAAIVDACGETGSVAFVGAPVEEAGRRYIACLRVSGEGADVVYRKSQLGGREAASFTPGRGPAVVELDGWRIGFGICKDTGTQEHVEATAALGIDLYLAGLVHLPSELDEQDARGRSISRRCNSYVAFAGFAGPTGDVFTETAGCSTIWDATGRAMARADARPGRFVKATLDADTGGASGSATRPAIDG